MKKLKFYKSLHSEHLYVLQELEATKWDFIYARYDSDWNEIFLGVTMNRHFLQEISHTEFKLILIDKKFKNNLLEEDFIIKGIPIEKYEELKNFVFNK